MKKNLIAINNKSMESVSLTLDYESFTHQNVMLPAVKCLKMYVDPLQCPDCQLLILTRALANLDILYKVLMIFHKIYYLLTTQCTG